MRFIALCLFCVIYTPALCALADWGRQNTVLRHAPGNISKLKRASPEPQWQDPRWLELDVIYPMRRYQSSHNSPPLKPLLNSETPTDVHPVHLTKAGGAHIKPNPNNGNNNAMRKGVNAMMDTLLSVRRLPDVTKK